MDWNPTIQGGLGPLYESIVEALARDIASGRLHRGQRLPTHRALAAALGVDLTTVTRAYNEARRRGLTEARVGQGTFVAESRLRVDRAPAGIDFDRKLPSPAALSPWSGATELKYAFRLKTLELWKFTGVNPDNAADWTKVGGPFDSAWWMPSHRAAIIEGGGAPGPSASSSVSP